MAPDGYPTWAEACIAAVEAGMKVGDSDHVRLVARETAGGSKNFLKCTRCGLEEWVLGDSPVKTWHPARRGRREGP